MCDGHVWIVCNSVMHFSDCEFKSIAQTNLMHNMECTVHATVDYLTYA